LIAYDPAWGFVATPSPLYGNGLSCIWTSTDGVQWDFSDSVVSMGNTLVATNGIFVSTSGINFVYASKDGGKTWTKTTMDRYTNTPSVIGQTFFFPTDDTSLLSSTDGITFDVYNSAFTMRQKRFPQKKKT
jgi:hypothetical protein